MNILHVIYLFMLYYFVLFFTACYFNFFKLCFIDYDISVVLIFSPISPCSMQHPPFCQGIPPPLFTSMGHAYRFFGYSISCTLHPHNYSVTTDLYFLVPLPFTHSLTPHSHLATITMLFVSINLSLFLFA